MVECVIMAIIAYLIGSLNISIFISKKMGGFDLRERGSKSTGATNVLRTVGKKAAVITLLFDMVKGVVAIVISILIGKIVQEANKELLLQVAGIAVVIGHTFPIFFGFKGGKGVATSLRNFVNDKLANRINLFSLCFSINSLNKNGVFRLLCGSYLISCFNVIY